MIPLTSVSEENTPVHHHPFNNHSPCVGGPSCSASAGSVRRYSTTVRLEHSSGGGANGSGARFHDLRNRLWSALTCCGGEDRPYCCAAIGGGGRGGELNRTTTKKYGAESVAPIGGRSQALMVDVVSRVLFPVMFAIFNMIYWPIYLW